ncbi:MAG TPA: Gfo/Idh/MocA family oxidoreductase [Candidatus Limnocylindrales bacterium]
MEELRWGILSTADIGRKKVVPAMKKAKRNRIVAVASREPDRAAEYATEIGIPTVHPSYEALLADPDVDAVYIPLPNHLHAEWAMTAARAKKHVLCEKPLAMNAADAARMVAVAEQEGVILAEAFMYRLHPSWQKVREIVASGGIGRLSAVQSWFGYYNDDPQNIRNIVEAGGGALYDVGCYCVNLSRMLFDGEPHRVSGALVRDPALGVDILTSGMLEFDTGVATFTCSTRTETDQRVHIYGTSGRISIGIPFNIPPDRPTQIYVTSGGNPPVAPDTETIEFDTADPYTVQAEFFAAAVLDGTPMPFPASDAVGNMRVIDLLFETAGTD